MVVDRSGAKAPSGEGRGTGVIRALVAGQDRGVGRGGYKNIVKAVRRGGYGVDPLRPDQFRCLLVGTDQGEVLDSHPTQFSERTRQWLHWAVAAPVLRAGAAAENQRPSLLNIVRQQRRHARVRDRGMRIDERLVVAQLVTCRSLPEIEYIDRNMPILQCFIPGGDTLPLQGPVPGV